MLKDYCEMVMSAAEMQKNHAAWLSVRKSSIGGSEAASILGLNPWKAAYPLWLEKTGQVEPEDISEKEPVRFGTILEQVVADEFCRREGKKVRKCGLYRSRKHPFMTASFDRLLVGEEAGLECKTANAFKRGEWDDGNIPDAYYVQCQHYMMVSGFPKWYLACLVGGNHFVTWEVERNETDIAALEAAEVDFWEKVQNGILPDMDGSESCTEALRNQFKGGGIEPIRLPMESLELLKRLDELKELKSGIEAEAKEIQNKLCAMLGDNETGLAGEGEEERKVTWKTVAGRTTIDSKRLKAEMPDVFAKYSKKSADSRRFIA
jgi:putative phage-type endonuclease